MPSVEKIRNFTPAITTMSDEVLRIASEQPAYFRTKTFNENVKQCEERLLKLIGCSGGRVAFLSCSGSGAMDAAVNNLIGANEKILVSM